MRRLDGWAQSMLDELEARVGELRLQLHDFGVELAIITDPASIAYLAGFWDYFGMDFGRPTLLAIARHGPPILITPLIELELARQMTWIEDVRPWTDDGEGRWDRLLAALAGRSGGVKLGIEAAEIHPAIHARLRELFGSELIDISPVLRSMRACKSPAEIAAMRKAGEIAAAMATASRNAIAAGEPEFEVTLAAMAAGTRKAAVLLEHERFGRLLSPVVHGLQALQSGPDTLMAHRRSSYRRPVRGDPVALCFCGMARYLQYNVGFDRLYFVADASAEQRRGYEIMMAAQAAALAAIRPGARAEDPQLAANDVYRSVGLTPGYRTGRGVGLSNVELPELKLGETAVLQERMTFAVDGAVTMEGRFGLRVSDTIVVVKGGYDRITPPIEEDPVA